MTTTIPFYKMVASGNDFIVIDNREQILRDPVSFAKRVCPRHSGVGADGLLLYEKSSRADFKMRIINSDGSEAEACGNGFRCIARYAVEKHGAASKFRFESQSGVIRAEINGAKIRVQLARTKDYRERREISVLGNRLHYSFINTGVPHTVIFVEGISKIDVAALGRAVRHDQAFKPKGTNVNFVEIKGEKDILVRTYERGVEGETLACGTGSTASAIVSTLMGYTKPPVNVKTSGGEILKIDFQVTGTRVWDVYLEGEAQFVYEGTIS
ncbi:MAG: diaminopimelate epimerase [Candidatus Omnitrophota bacterium]|nr:diaminopimelate epimerase [Candidatus Omnitrophota bacterium]